ncbi:MAG TPA: hypothetical protein VHO03_00095 [Ignavibacteriales bacterium]|nr:hypothetical protein [Ignavibacteriales bacterium]
MKRLTLIFACLFCFLPDLEAQTYQGLAGEMFLFSQPNARAEALGRGNAALTGSPFLDFYNPAASSFSAPVTLEFTRLDFFPAVKWIDRTEDYDTYGIGANFGMFGAFSMNYMHFSGGEEFFNTDAANPEGLGVWPISTEIYMINYSFQILKDFSAGVNANYFKETYKTSKSLEHKGWYFDLGVLKKYKIESSSSNQEVYLGLSLTNFANSKFPITVSSFGRTLTHYLPSALRLAAAYEFQPQNKMGNFGLFKGLFLAEYRDLVNSKYNTKFQLGTELTFLEIIKLRAGWFTEGLNDYGHHFNKSRLNELTYGFGIEAPVKKLTGLNLPMNIQFDYTSLPFPEYYNDDLRHNDNSPIYSFNISYGI